VPTNDLSDDELAAVIAALWRVINDDRFPMSPCLLKAALAKLDPAYGPQPLRKRIPLPEVRGRRPRPETGAWALTDLPRPADLRAKVFEDRAVPGQWRVEKMDADGGVECIEIFSGPSARQRAIDYVQHRFGDFDLISP
jgi:hypothetical protein